MLGGLQKPTKSENKTSPQIEISRRKKEAQKQQPQENSEKSVRATQETPFVVASGVNGDRSSDRLGAKLAKSDDDEGGEHVYQLVEDAQAAKFSLEESESWERREEFFSHTNISAAKTTKKKTTSAEKISPTAVSSAVGRTNKSKVFAVSNLELAPPPVILPKVENESEKFLHNIEKKKIEATEKKEKVYIDVVSVRRQTLVTLLGDFSPSRAPVALGFATISDEALPALEDASTLNRARGRQLKINIDGGFSGAGGSPMARRTKLRNTGKEGGRAKDGAGEVRDLDTDDEEMLSPRVAQIRKNSEGEMVAQMEVNMDEDAFKLRLKYVYIFYVTFFSV